MPIVEIMSQFRLDHHGKHGRLKFLKISTKLLLINCLKDFENKGRKRERKKERVGH